jgi:hypothetical protein
MPSGLLVTTSAFSWWARATMPVPSPPSTKSRASVCPLDYWRRHRAELTPTGQKRALGSRCALHRNAYHAGTHHRDLAVALPQIAVKRQIRPASQTKTAPVRWSLDHMSELVIKLRHSLQFILCGVIHCVIGIPTLTGIGCGGCRSGSCGARGRSRGAVWNGSSCRGIRRCGCC